METKDKINLISIFMGTQVVEETQYFHPRFKGISWTGWFCSTDDRERSLQMALENASDFDSNWNSLMRVIQKIDSLYESAFPSGAEFIKKILAKEKIMDSEYLRVVAMPLGTPIVEAFEAVVAFILWHNEQNNKNQ